MSRTTDLTPSLTKVVVLVLKNNQGDILLTQRQKHQHLAGYWEFPGGKIEADESPFEALKRECMEELDYHIIAPEKILTINHQYPTIKVQLQIFYETNTHPQVKPAEGQCMKWVNINDLDQYKLPEANQAIIEHLQSNAL